jgi:hypothetical protein
MPRERMSVYLQRLIAATACAAALFAATAAKADCACSSSQPGLLEFLVSKFSSSQASCVPCPTAYNGDYMVNQGPVYSGPAVIAPHATYEPTPTASGYPYVSGQYDANALAQYESRADDAQLGTEYRPPAQLHRRAHRSVVFRRAPARKVVILRKISPKKKGTQIIRARAEVRIYSKQRMDIHLYR